MNKPHGNTGKKNALKPGEACRARAALRLPQSIKDAAEEDAKRMGISPSSWYLIAVKKALPLEPPFD